MAFWSNWSFRGTGSSLFSLAAKSACMVAGAGIGFIAANILGLGGVYVVALVASKIGLSSWLGVTAIAATGKIAGAALTAYAGQRLANWGRLPWWMSTAAQGIKYGSLTEVLTQFPGTMNDVYSKLHGFADTGMNWWGTNVDKGVLPVSKYLPKVGLAL